ncbi:MAG: thioesterase domain-containing protein [Candidatus Kapaibacterium sp.]
MQRFKSTYWTASEDDPKSLDKVTEEAYSFIMKNHKEGGKIILYGYSWGAVLTNHLAKRLKSQGKSIDLLITVDMAAGDRSSKLDRTISDNVKFNINYYQTNADITGARGGPNTVTQGSMTKIINDNETGSAGHGSIDEYVNPAAAKNMLDYLKGTFHDNF